MFKTTTTAATVTTTEIDLHALPYAQWPIEAKECAYRVIAVQKNRQAFKALPMDQRKEWLVAKVIALNELIQEFKEL